MGTVRSGVEQRGQARASMSRTWRRSCSHGTRWRSEPTDSAGGEAGTAVGAGTCCGSRRRRGVAPGGCRGTTPAPPDDGGRRAARALGGYVPGMRPRSAQLVHHLPVRPARSPLPDDRLHNAMRILLRDRRRAPARRPPRPGPGRARPGRGSCATCSSWRPPPVRGAQRRNGPSRWSCSRS